MLLAAGLKFCWQLESPLSRKREVKLKNSAPKQCREQWLQVKLIGIEYTRRNTHRGCVRSRVQNRGIFIPQKLSGSREIVGVAELLINDDLSGNLLCNCYFFYRDRHPRSLRVSNEFLRRQNKTPANLRHYERAFERC